MATQTWNVNNDLVKGSNMNLYLVMPTTAGTIDYSTEKVMAYATSCEFSMNAETIDTSSKLSCRWTSVVQGNASYTVSAEALYCLQANAAANSAYTVDDLFEALKEGFNIG